VDGPANASPDDRHDQLLDAFLLPSQPLTAKVLRRPVESALGSPVGVEDRAGQLALAAGGDRGLAKTHLQHVLTALALNLVRVDAWLTGVATTGSWTSRLARLTQPLPAT